MGDFARKCAISLKYERLCKALFDIRIITKYKKRHHPKNGIKRIKKVIFG
jgi:hypothetical protein